jgi:sugar phosphate isomerase/epimerase
MDMDLLGIENQTVMGLPPVEFVRLAADLECKYISISINERMYNPHGYEQFSVRDDAALRRRIVTALRDHGVSISLGDGFIVRPGSDVRDRARDLDTMAELGVTRINTVSLDPDLSRSFDEFGALAEMAASRGIETTLEFALMLTVTDLDTALAAVRHVARPDFRLLIDTMHLVRSGSSASDLEALDPRLIGYAHLSDHTLEQCGDTYWDDVSNRRVPGEGELPLRDIVAALPPDIVIGVEVPMLSRAEAGESTQDRTRRVMQGARTVLASVRGGDAPPRA